ncbi:hypothetical protein C7M84_014903 [Penaeus vannamei]|uniref:Sulfatase N-terminal domain-containing protein n=1 Tax=Penaeus vannamei TaxID=6689 RepID=A0A3R7SMC9_PENVA|nr:arylsulfatase B-like [Penaeus vannamei]XP_027225960.1 arylsulfatase B-like [Penaeus vannamei]XP_027225961.1 arylsulfatase B-like [Penaeus vannamei]XP_027225962.1 arylsulfatase B-like [Penaeus vannamei]ROT67034.1 hypothetical protein C7M84_014903 [Penaeus vannamei]
MSFKGPCPAVAPALLALLWLSAVPASASAAADSAPNIVFILADDLGWNDVSWHNDQVVSPNMQQLVDTGVQLEQSYVQPLCTPSRSAFLTGLYPFRLGRQGRPLGSHTPTGLAVHHTLLPERLSRLGYSTHMIGKWHLGFCDWAYTPLERGFDTFYGYYGGFEFHFSHTVSNGYDFRDQREPDFTANGTYATHLFGDRAVRIIEEHQGSDQPFFLYLALQNVHKPLEVPDEYLAHYPEDLDEDRRLLLGMVTALDEAVGRVVQALKDTGLYDNTVIVFSSDNGGVGMNGESNRPLRGNKSSVWEGGTRAVGFVHSPLLQETPRVHSGLLHITDWYNTLLALAGESFLPDNDGFNQWDSLVDPSVESPRIMFFYNLDYDPEKGMLGALRLNDYKFVVGEERDLDPGEEPGLWLFNLTVDPNEIINMVEVQPALAMAMEMLMLEELPNVVPRDEPDNDPAGDPSNWGGVWSPGWCDVP